MNVEEWLGEENQLGIDIWHKKYQVNNETFDEWLDRVSGKNEKVKQLIVSKKFLFGGRILSNRGTSGVKTSLSNCYVITPPEDNIESIYETCSKLARTYSYGGGCGIDISKLAPKGAKVNNQARTTSGAVSFMDTFSQVTEQIGQNGRRRALMISMDCTHPDLEDFITIKTDLNKVTAANISVRVTDKFMQAVINDEDWHLTFSRPEINETIVKTVKAKDIYKLLCKNNWDYAEPRILFWDRIEKYNLLDTNKEFHYAGTNPCAEEPLPSGGSCLLRSINLSEFVSENGTFKFDEFSKCVEIAIEGLNEVLEEGIVRHPLQEQRDTVNSWRQCGLGIMGLADMLIKMKIVYGSDESVKLCDAIGRTMATCAIKASSNIAKTLGSYPKFNKEEVLESAFFKAHSTDELKDCINTNGLRNSQLLTIAPTGTLSTMLQISGGIEPIFANSYTRTTKSLHNEDVDYKVFTPIVKKYMEEHGITEEEDLPKFFVTSGDIGVEQRVAMQSIWQKHIDASISSTVNLPEEATVEEVEKLYMEAWKQGLKGITVFRSGCKRVAILNNDSSSKSKVEVEEPILQDSNVMSYDTLPRGYIVDCSDDLIRKKRKLQTGCGSLHVIAFFDKDDAFIQEVYLSKGSTGGCQNFMIGLSRTISLLCRAGVDIYTIKDQLDSTGACPSYASRTATKHDTSKGSCCPMAIGNALIDMYEETLDELGIDMEDGYEDNSDCICDTLNVENTTANKNVRSEKCPECGEVLRNEGGCVQCPSCGWSRCG